MTVRLRWWLVAGVMILVAASTLAITVSHNGLITPERVVDGRFDGPEPDPGSDRNVLFDSDTGVGYFSYVAGGRRIAAYRTARTRHCGQPRPTHSEVWSWDWPT